MDNPADNATAILCSTPGCHRKLPQRPQMHGGQQATKEETLRLYRPFQDSANEIRLVRFLKGTRQNVIECELITVTLRASPPLDTTVDSNAQASGQLENTNPPRSDIVWQALSYTWGEVSHPRTILINGTPISIGRNLLEALVWFRINGSNTALWIDALCINQDDILERGAQVGQMHRIYSLAANVVVFIPTRIGRIGKNNLIPRCLVTSVDLPDAEDIKTLKRDMEAWAKGEEDNLALDTLSQLLENQESFSSYWRRLWTFQECALAPSLLVIAGPLTLPWTKLQAMVAQIPEIVKQIGGDFSDAPPWTRKIISFLCPGASMRERMRSWEGQLTELLVVTTHEVSSEPRDSVYAMLGLLKHTSIVVDYTICVTCFAQRVTQGIIHDTKRLDFLGIASSAADCPSWIPDLAHVPFSSYHMREYRLMKESEPAFDIGPRQERLHAQGLALGQLGVESYKHAKEPDSVSPTQEECELLVAGVKDLIDRTVMSSDARKYCYRDLARLTVDLDPMSTMWYQRELENLMTGDGNMPEASDTVRAAFRTGFDTLRDYHVGVCQNTSGGALLLCHDLEEAKAGDIVCQIHGCRYPLLVRRRDHGDQLLGRCYLGGFGMSQEIGGPHEVLGEVRTFNFT